jgi:hypothetical protein
MAQQLINVGASPNDGQGDSIRTAFSKTNNNFSELYSYFQVAPPPSLTGSVGDHAGMIANDANYFYYCFANFDGVSTIWAQIAQVGNVSLPSINNGTSNVVVSPSGNVSIAVAGVANVGVFGTSSLNIRGQISATGNVSGANIAAISTVSAAAIVSSTDISAVGNVAGNYILGNGSQLTGITTNYGNANVADYLPTYTGNIQGQSISVNDRISAVGNISGNYILGNGSQLTGLPATYADANVAAYLPTYVGNLVSLEGNITTTANISGNYILGNGSQLTGVVADYSNANVAAYLPFYSGNLVGLEGDVNTTGNIAGNYILGNGSLLSGITANYSNANVAAYLPTYTGNLNSLTGPVRTSANITGGNLSVNNQVSVFGNVTARYFVGDGSLLTGLPSTYTNANVSAYLPTYSGNIGANNVSVTGDVSVAGSINGNLTGLVNGIDIRYLSFDFGFVDTTAPYTNPIQYLLAFTGAGNIDMGTISAPAALNIDAGGTMS